LHSRCTASPHFFLNKGQAIITHARYGEHGDAVRFLDTSATNHVKGLVDPFAKLEHSITGKVHFVGRSVRDIHGRGTVMFTIDGEITARSWSFSSSQRSREAS
jgi:hypothetical protein